jgi:hypothetical protein
MFPDRMNRIDAVFLLASRRRLKLEAAPNLWFNMLHICGDNIHFKSMADYPVHIFHWDTNLEGNPDFEAGVDELTAAVGGGVSIKTMGYGTLDEVETQMQKAFMQTKGRRFLLGPACSVPIPQTPEAHLWALKEGSKTFGL